ncbi:Protein of unknown function (DUF3813) [Schinkia azotoformans MEV2011]|uniref:DUF3813 domain-containing protein n=1 Tax=Schinkia azotoformans MEV2011 TaxID=1348973 RepID=A0A072NMZ2_SCHAZ|nr:DUF3813 domain-containing protein [Schinkia azotoformans]KEF38293.1 Protein of unknown function (DUF3813) [Schinkia azotoformans MEV2011]MEC1694037.1 DUF3813 domain-containing protein [Schinkia azotoformans]MEC1715749.1 DUF3813 domain-containing protein [Schinkia azotoformans]MEC1724958.1 DUF3813 domain-containing protein [Schinkia azotoformans]MEC1741388.1 DUF3813 domain-containing protein [Schinkia azotoformans]
MGNKLFQMAKEAVYWAETTSHLDDIEKAKNQISSAFANSTAAEQMQLQELQQRLDGVQNSSNGS